MTKFTKTLISSLLASVFVIMASAQAQDIFIENVMLNDQRVIEVDEHTSGEVERSIVINAKKGKATRIFVDEDGRQYHFKLTDSEIADLDILNRKLEVLSGETLIKVRSALRSVNQSMVRMRDSGLLNSIMVELDGDEFDTDIDFDFSSIENIKGLADLKKLEVLGELSELKELKVLDLLMSKEHAKVIRERIRQDHHNERLERLSERSEQLLEQQHRVREAQEVRVERLHRDVEQKVRRLHSERQRVFIIDGEDSSVVYDIDGNRVSNLHGHVKRFTLTSDNMVLKGHVDAILKLISHGEFTPDELDKLQQMLDSKR